MPRKKTAAEGLSAEGAPWLDRRAIEIAANHLGAVNEEPNGEWLVGDNCGLIMHRNDCWHDFLNEKTCHGHEQLGRADGDDEDGEDAEAIAADYAWSTAYVDMVWCGGPPRRSGTRRRERT